MKKLMVNKTIRKTWAWLLITIMVVALAIPASMSAVAASTSVVITESAGWLESAYAEWQPVTNATGYVVYYKTAGAADTAYTKIDDMLIREYTDYFRADAVGLAAGNYVMKVVPIVSGSENAEKAAFTSTLAVTAHTREGFAFSQQSIAKTGSGGYNDNGTVPSNAQIIYVTEANKNTVTASVISSSNGTSTTIYTGIGAILAARSKGYDTRPLIIRVVGKVTMFTNSANVNYVQIKQTKNVTIEGIGEDATLYGMGILVRSTTNIEIRNIGVMMFPDDGISLDTDNNNIWIHNNDIYYGAPGSDADQVKGDGSSDVKSNSNYVTVSYNHFWDSGKVSLCGMKEPNEFFVTYHHNWFDHSDSRHPRIRVGTIHIYNNYYDGNSKYGVGATTGSSAFVENNYFRNCKYPMLISLQGTDIAGGAAGTFSQEAGGMIKAYGNTITGATAFVDQNSSATSFDAVVVADRNNQVASTYKTVSGATSYNNFDTAATMYTYTPDTAEIAKSKVMTYAGRINGGDLKWTFTTADDSSSSINVELKSAITAYTSKLVSIGGVPVKDVVIDETQSSTEATTQSSTQATTQSSTESTTAAPTQPAGSSKIHNFTDGLTSSFFTITGSLSTSKGTVIYSGLTITQCLKLETATTITFTAPTSGKLTMVFVSQTDTTKSVNIKVNGTKLTAAASDITANYAVITVDVKAGSNAITKADSNNLFYITFVPEGSENSTTAPTQATTTAPTQATTQAETTAPTSDVGSNSPAEVVDSTSVITADKISSEILDSNEALVTVTTNTAPQLDSTVLGNIAEKDKEVTVKVVNSQNQLLYTWTFDGKTISNASLTLDMSISFDTEKQQEIETLTGQTNALYLSFAHHGELPGPAKITTYVGDKYKNGEVLYLYYYDEELQKTELISDSGLTVINGYVEYTLTHCSVYFLSLNDQLANETETTIQPVVNSGETIATSDNNIVVIYLVSIFIASGMLFLSYFSKKRRA